MCAAFWRGLPEWLRSNFTSPASDTGTRRAAAREIIERARAHRQNNEQLRLKL